VTDQIAAGAAMLICSLSVGFLAIRWYVRPEPTAKHRAARVWFRPVQALVETTVRCRFEHRDTVHVRTRVTDELICRSCGHIHGGAR
jgi:hypothetical protein